MDKLIHDAGPLPDEEDEVEDKAKETRYRVGYIFIDVIDKEYDEDANIDYDEQEEMDGEEVEEDYSMSEGGEAIDEDLVCDKWGEPSPIHITRS